MGDIQKFQEQIQNKFNLINRFETINSQNEKKLCQLQQENLKISQVNNTLQKDLTSLKSVCENLINSVEGLGSEIDSFYPPIDALLDCVRPPKLGHVNFWTKFGRIWTKFGQILKFIRFFENIYQTNRES